MIQNRMFSRILGHVTLQPVLIQPLLAPEASSHCCVLSYVRRPCNLMGRSCARSKGVVGSTNVLRPRYAFVISGSHFHPTCKNVNLVMVCFASHLSNSKHSVRLKRPPRHGWSRVRFRYQLSMPHHSNHQLQLCVIAHLSNTSFDVCFEYFRTIIST
jgi:hypothetical protein